MIIRCWGSRGSIPVSGIDFVKYGGDTTCIEIRTKNDEIIIVDAGTGIRRLGNKLIEEGRYEYNLLFTHVHWDHIMGFPVFKPAFNSKTKIRVHRCPFHDKQNGNIISRVMSPPNFPVSYTGLQASLIFEDLTNKSFVIDSVTVTPLRISHPNGGCGFKFTEGNKSFVFLTDNELGFRHKGGLEFNDYVKFVDRADLLIHDAEYTGIEYSNVIGWGHSSCEDVLDLATRAKVKDLGLFHLNQERTDQEMDKMVKECRETQKHKKSTINIFAVSADMIFHL